jgi:sulfatase maturation enzyme AslB (radical SAM superfamily)
LKGYVKFWRDTGVDGIFATALWDFKRNGDVFSCANNHGAARYAMGNACQTPLEEILRSDNFINDKAAKMTRDIKRAPAPS